VRSHGPVILWTLWNPRTWGLAVLDIVLASGSCTLYIYQSVSGVARCPHAVITVVAVQFRRYKMQADHERVLYIALSEELPFQESEMVPGAQDPSSIACRKCTSSRLACCSHEPPHVKDRTDCRRREMATKDNYRASKTVKYNERKHNSTA